GLLLSCLEEVLRGAEVLGEALSPRAAAGRAYERYVSKLPEGGPQPGLNYFRALISLNEKWAHPKALAMLGCSGSVERVGQKEKTPINRDLLLSCLEEVLKGAEGLGETLAPHAAADRAYERYVSKLPEGAFQPSQSSFRLLISLSEKWAYPKALA